MKVVEGTMESLCTTKLPQGLDKHNMSPSSTHTRPTRILEPSQKARREGTLHVPLFTHIINSFVTKNQVNVSGVLLATVLFFVCL